MTGASHRDRDLDLVGEWTHTHTQCCSALKDRGSVKGWCGEKRGWVWCPEWRLMTGSHWWHWSLTAAAWISACFQAALQNGCLSLPSPLLLQLPSSLCLACAPSLSTADEGRRPELGGFGGREEDVPCFWSFLLSPHLHPSVGSYTLQTAISASGLPASCAIKRAFVLMIDNRYHVVGAELEHVQHQILPLWLHNMSESRFLSEICQLG